MEKKFIKVDKDRITHAVGLRETDPLVVPLVGRLYKDSSSPDKETPTESQHHWLVQIALHACFVCPFLIGPVSGLQ